MTRCTIAAIMVVLISVHAATAENQDATAQINAAQKERVEGLTALVGIYTGQFRVGTVSNEPLVSAEGDLVNAQLAATNQSEQRIALLTEALKKEQEILKIVDRVCGARETDIAWWRLISQDTQIKLLQAQKDQTAQIKALQTQRIVELTKLTEIRASQYEVGTILPDAFVIAEVALVNARTDTTDKREERVALLTQRSKREADFLKIAESRFHAGTVTQADVYLAQSLLLATKIRLWRESGGQENTADQVKAAQKERIEALTKLAKLDETYYKAGDTDCETIASAETALVNAQVDAADSSNARIALLQAAARRGADFLKTADAKFKAGKVSQADVYRARAVLLDTEIRLLQERVLQKATTK